MYLRLPYASSTETELWCYQTREAQTASWEELEEEMRGGWRREEERAEAEQEEEEEGEEVERERRRRREAEAECEELRVKSAICLGLLPEIQCQNPQFQSNLYQECGFVCLISGCALLLCDVRY
eukprot:569263-Rhodomonas_salina.1